MCVHVCYVVQSTLFKTEVTLNLQESGKKISTRIEEYASIELLDECGVSVYGKHETMAISILIVYHSLWARP